MGREYKHLPGETRRRVEAVAPQGEAPQGGVEGGGVREGAEAARVDRVGAELQVRQARVGLQHLGEHERERGTTTWMEGGV